MVSSRFTFYPLFRLSVALATGIFLSDVFALDGTYLYALCFVFVLSVLLSSIFYFSKTYRIRFLFGISVSLSFLLLGGILFVISLENIHHEWDSDKAVYVASVCDIPRVKGKTIQATVNVEKVKDVATGSWKLVNKQILLIGCLILCNPHYNVEIECAFGHMSGCLCLMQILRDLIMDNIFSDRG